MKITIDIDCTPAEAREFVGLPDLRRRGHFEAQDRPQLSDGSRPNLESALLEILSTL